VLLAKPADDAVDPGMRIIIEALESRALPGVNPAKRPPSLFHFTDLSGFEGIHASKKLWASHVASLNDLSEGVHGRRRCKRFLEQYQGSSPKDLFARLVLRLLDPANSPPPLEIDIQPYVVSFCARKDGAIHWLAYGREGTGLAIDFDPWGLVPADAGKDLGFELAPVIYKRAEQVKVFADLLDAVWAVLPGATAGLGPHDEKFLRHYAAHATAMFMTLATARMKKYAFRDEREWRLISYDAFGAFPSKDNLPTTLRRRGGGVVAYKELPFPPAALRAVEVGWSFPMMRTRGALRPLAAHYGVPVRRSIVPIRPTSG
jgi:hypothetical protein